ncbi:hypothetical protein [Rhodococcus sp. CH91]|uniref:hypothetical protein n=1 Tax=Rhodococcus sp. CH91 TaxID=2910256 RepID=UPI001F4AEBAE|nr:hypothetical protein [Rhodococcus sp. CH91]
MAESFRAGVELPDDCRIEIADDRLWVLFPESDFVIQTRPADGPDSVHLIFSVAVRAPEPSLETWWDKWSVPAERRVQAEVARDEILTSRKMILRMLDERFGAGRRSAEMRYA